MASMICILGAVKQEISGIKNRMTIEERVKLGKSDAWSGSWEGCPLVLVRTGIGKRSAAEALEKTLQKFDPSLIISMGYTGATDPTLKIGDIVIADRILEIQTEGDADFSAKQPVREFRADSVHVDRAMNLSAPEGVTVRRGGLLTVDKPVCDPQHKHAAGTLYDVLAVEMETSAMVPVAGRKNIPFLSVRSVSDTAEEELMDVSPFISADGEVSKVKAGWHVLTHPQSIGNVIAMRDHAHRATETLTDFLQAFLKSFSPKPRTGTRGSPSGDDRISRI